MRENIHHYIEDEDWVVTIMKPTSTEHGGKLVVVYEDAYGDIEIKIMTPKAIVANYQVDAKELEGFMESKNEENENEVT